MEMGSKKYAGKINMCSAEELGEDILSVFSAKELKDLAEKRIIPYYEVVNPLTLEVKIFFKNHELREWIKEKCTNRKISVYEPVYNFFSPDGEQINESTCVFPKELSAVKNLRRLSLNAVYTMPGIYFLCLNGKIQYIGQAVCVISRVKNHEDNPHKEFDSCFFITVQKESLFEIEKALIKFYQPPLNQKEKCMKSQTEEHRQIIKDLIIQ